MKLRYLCLAAVALGLFAGQPVLAQSTTHDAPAKTSQTKTHKSKHKKKKSTETAPSSDMSKTQ